jgi:Putative peptidoglycan binding domain
MPRATAPRLVALALMVAAVAGCGFGEDDGQATTTLPTLPPSSGVTTPPTTAAPPTAAPTTPPLTAPTGGPNTLPPIPGLVTTRPPATTVAAGGGRITYVNEPASGALQLGHKGSRVQTMQGQLLSLGYQLGVDGYFGRGTEAAVRQFQQAQGLPADGIAGPPTIERLAQVAPAG